jgi:transcription antitermination factor NusG
MVETICIPRSNPSVANETELPEWFAVHCVPNHEKRIAEHFCVRQIEHFLPLFEALRKRHDGSKVTLRVPLFPTYIFVRIVRTRRVPVLEVPSVLSILGNKRHPCSIPDSYIELLRQGVASRQMQPHPYIAVGTRVRVKSGAMAGAEGVLLRTKGRFRVVMTLELVMKSVAMEVDLTDLEAAIPLHSSS